MDYKNGKRKSIAILDIIEEVNRRNKQSTCSAEIRKGWNSLLESILHSNSVYHGFRYLGKGEVPKDCLPGIREKEGEGVEFPDDTRIEFYAHRHLQKKYNV